MDSGDLRRKNKAVEVTVQTFSKVYGDVKEDCLPILLYYLTLVS